ncbi:hypothetical protein SLOPH_1660, partial [Spraguea lophii 42_110]
IFEKTIHTSFYFILFNLFLYIILMDISLLQNEINHLLYLYYNIIGLTQSSVDDAKILVEELLLCKHRIEQIIDEYKNNNQEENMENEIKNAASYIEEGYAFLDNLIHDL